MKRLNVFLAASLFGTPLFLSAEEFDVGQFNKNFSLEQLSIKVGDTVNFTNQDPFFHNVYSLSSPYFFDLGSYPKGEYRSVLFDKPGVIDVECAIHPQMRLTIKVE